MSEDNNLPTRTDAAKSELRTLVTSDDLSAVDFEGPIRGLDTADTQEFYSAYERAFAAACKANDEVAQVVYRLLAQLCSMALRPSDPGDVWTPLFTMANGTRAPVAEDFRGEQTAILATVVGRIVSPVLKARIADIVWSNNRRDGVNAAAAIDAYCDSVASLLEGNLKPRFGMPATHEGIPALQRAMQIAQATTKRTRRPEKVERTFETFYVAAWEHRDVSSFVSAAELALWYGLRKPDVAAAELEAVAASVPAGTFPLAVKRAWDLAARLYEKLNDREARQRCLIAAVEQTLAMREQVKGSAAAEASWVTEALQQLRHVEGMEDREQSLEVELRRLQKASLKQMGKFDIDLQLGDSREKIAEHFAKLSLSDALRRFALLTRSRDPARLRDEALNVAKNAPLMAMMAGVHVDSEGRPESRSTGAPHEGAPDPTWFHRIIGQSERIRRARTVAGAIDPARLEIQARFGITERHFSAIVGLSPFIRDSQKPIVALGFARFFQGDFMSATHLLIPQLEPCLRHLLKINGHDPSKRRDDSTEEDLSLSGLYLHFRPELDQILTPAIAFEIDLLFNAKPGPELRHELAHGQISAAACFDADVYYANWLIYHLCCLLIVQSWDELVAPRLAEAE
ncbi:MAG TPA: hypothetical protein VMU69_22805 [Bradyrhizobium sp.]|nr:hypothetical protein [Bradyrhizobium sp.]